MNPVTDISDYIPQRAPFVMIDSLEWCNNEGAGSGFTVKPDNLFVENGWLTEPALIENMAQTAAARMGYLCRMENKPVPVGFIGAVQNLIINKLPAIHETLQTSISIKNQIFNATIIEGSISVSGKEIASCEMKIFISE